MRTKNLLFLCMAMALLLSACSYGGASQQFKRGYASPQEMFAMVSQPFFMNVEGNHYLINGENDNFNSNWAKFKQAMNPQPNEFSVCISPELVERLSYNNNVRMFFGQIGYICSNQQLVDVQYLPKENQGTKSPRTMERKMHQMNFIWGGHSEKPELQQSKKASINWANLWNYGLPTLIVIGSSIAIAAGNN